MQNSVGIFSFPIQQFSHSSHTAILKGAYLSFANRIYLEYSGGSWAVLARGGFGCMSGVSSPYPLSFLRHSLSTLTDLRAPAPACLHTTHLCFSGAGGALCLHTYDPWRPEDMGSPRTGVTGGCESTCESWNPTWVLWKSSQRS